VAVRQRISRPSNNQEGNQMRPPKLPPKFQVYPEMTKDKKPTGRFRWRLVAANGHITADGGQGYASRYNARRACKATIMSLTYYVRIEDL